MHVARWPVELESRDGQPHAVELLVAHDTEGLQVSPARVVVPALGGVRVALCVWRGDAAWGSRRELHLVALENDAPLGLGSAVVEVERDPALVPRLRPLLVALGGLLLAAAAVAEWRRGAAT